MFNFTLCPVRPLHRIRVDLAVETRRHKSSCAAVLSVCREHRPLHVCVSECPESLSTMLARLAARSRPWCVSCEGRRLGLLRRCRQRAAGGRIARQSSRPHSSLRRALSNHARTVLKRLDLHPDEINPGVFDGSWVRWSASAAPPTNEAGLRRCSVQGPYLSARRAVPCALVRISSVALSLRIARRTDHR